MLSVTVVLVLLIGIINVMNYRSVVRNADRILTMLTDGGGRFPDNSSGKTGDRDEFPTEHGQEAQTGQEKRRFRQRG